MLNVDRIIETRISIIPERLYSKVMAYRLYHARTVHVYTCTPIRPQIQRIFDRRLSMLCAVHSEIAVKHLNVSLH